LIALSLPGFAIVEATFTGRGPKSASEPVHCQGLVVVITVPGAGVVSGATVSSALWRSSRSARRPRAKNDRKRLEPAWAVVDPRTRRAASGELVEGATACLGATGRGHAARDPSC
jgi:hypothetical protein